MPFISTILGKFFFFLCYPVLNTGYTTHLLQYIFYLFFLASLLNSRIPCFEFSNLKDCYKSLSPDDASLFFIDVLKIMTENPLDSWNVHVVSYPNDYLFINYVG